MRRPGRRPALPVAAMLLLAACSGTEFYENGKRIEPPACPGDAQPMTRVELLFGRSRAGGPPVTDAEWTAFIEAEVAPRFPEGFTVFDGSGGWGGRDGRVQRERSHLLLIWYPASQHREAGVEAIRAAYKKRFGQESVLRAHGTSCVAL